MLITNIVHVQPAGPLDLNSEIFPLVKVNPSGRLPPPQLMLPNKCRQHARLPQPSSRKQKDPAIIKFFLSCYSPSCRATLGRPFPSDTPTHNLASTVQESQTQSHCGQSGTLCPAVSHSLRAEHATSCDCVSC